MIAGVRGQHTRPQAPQAASLVRSDSQPVESVSSQSPYPGSQSAITHSESTQPLEAWARSQRMSQLPQCSGSVVVSTQLDPHNVSSGPQPDTHSYPEA